MTEYEQMAQEVVAAVSNNKNTTPTDEVNKMASERGLSKEAQQRLVEETNIGLFLDKMKDGTHYEDFELANPEVIDVSSSTGSSGSLNKEASLQDISFDAGAFCLSELPKVAKKSPYLNVDINEGIYNMHLKTEEIEETKREQEELEKIASENALENRQFDEWYSDIAYKIRGDADLVKTACAYLHKDNPELVQEILHETTLNSDEIKDGIVSEKSISDLAKVASEKNPKSSSFGNSFRDTMHVLKYPLRNPKTALGLGAAAYSFGKASINDREIHQRQEMMVPNKD